jgi:hypothetical protein
MARRKLRRGRLSRSGGAGRPGITIGWIKGGLTPFGFDLGTSAGHQFGAGFGFVGKEGGGEAQCLDFDLHLAELGFLISQDLVHVTH